MISTVLIVAALLTALLAHRAKNDRQFHTLIESVLLAAKGPWDVSTKSISYAASQLMGPFAHPGTFRRVPHREEKRRVVKFREGRSEPGVRRINSAML